MTRSPLILDEFLPYRLSFTANLVSGAIAAAYRSHFGLGIPEWRVIAHVAEREGVTQQEIRTRTRMDKVTVSRATIALTGRGLIRREPHPDDGRLQRLVLTPAGQTLYAAIAPEAKALESAIFGRFPAAELAAFTRMLRRIDAVIEDVSTAAV